MIFFSEQNIYKWHLVLLYGSAILWHSSEGAFSVHFQFDRDQTKSKMTGKYLLYRICWLSVWEVNISVIF